jgi:uncharacterized protein YbbK (DUF523 family)
MKRKIKIGISACLIGKNCRYDSRSKLDTELKEFLEKQFEIVPICPEVEYGMSVPRDPANLVVQEGQRRFITLNSNCDLTKEFLDWINGKIKVIERENLRGFVFKSRSPSCALYDAKIYASKIEGETFSFGPGLFAEAVMNHFPSIISEDENVLSESFNKIDFVRRVKKSGEKR